MNKFLLVIFLALLCRATSAQPVKGDINVNPGVGAGFYYTGGSSISVPPVGAGLDYNIDDRFSIGGIVTHSTAAYNYAGYGKYRLSYLVFGARGNYLFNVDNEKLDPYIGAVMAFNNFSSKWSGAFVDPGYKFNAGLVLPGFYFGGRYFFQDNLGAYAEIGYPMIRIGVTFKNPLAPEDHNHAHFAFR